MQFNKFGVAWCLFLVQPDIRQQYLSVITVDHSYSKRIALT